MAKLLGIDWKPEIRAVADLHKWDKNPRKITEVNYTRLKKKILEEGMHQVLTIDTDNTVLSGNQRLEILKEVGVEEVYCMVPERALTPEERDKVGIQSNLIEGIWDNDMLANVFDIPMLLEQGFTKLQLGMNPLEEDDFDADKEMAGVKVLAKPGDIYRLGDHRIACLDSTILEDVEKLMDGEKAHLVFTDPPYMVDYHSPAGNTYKSSKYGGEGGAIFNDDLSEKEAREFFTKVLKNLYVVTTDDACIYWWFANRNNWINRLAFIDSGWKMSQIIVWIKNSMIFAAGQDYHRQYEPVMFGWKDGKTHFKNKMYAKFKDVYNLDFDDYQQMFDVWYEKRDSTASYIHPTTKPVRLAERALRKHSEIGDIVVDLFSGSFSTGIACQQGNRRCFANELDPKYVHAGIKRFMKSYPQEPVACLTRDVNMELFLK
jgi:DNA modification methylase